MNDCVSGKVQNESKKEDNANKIKKTLCEPCAEDNKEESVEGFCIDCQEYLCDNCFKYHCIPRLTKKHKLLDKSKMPKRKVERDVSTVCQKHIGEEMNHYCKDHDVIGCYSCLFPEHNSCSGTCWLTEAADDVETSRIYKEFFDRVSKTEEEFEKLEKSACQNYQESISYCTAAITHIKECQKQINAQFEKVTKEVNEIGQKDSTTIERIQKISEGAKAELNHLKEDLKLLEQTKQSKQLFIVINRARHNQDFLEERLRGLKTENNIKKYKFVESDNLGALLENRSVLGSLIYHAESVDVNI